MTSKTSILFQSALTVSTKPQIEKMYGGVSADVE